MSRVVVWILNNSTESKGITEALGLNDNEDVNDNNNRLHCKLLFTRCIWGSHVVDGEAIERDGLSMYHEDCALCVHFVDHHVAQVRNGLFLVHQIVHVKYDNEWYTKLLMLNTIMSGTKLFLC